MRADDLSPLNKLFCTPDLWVQLRDALTIAQSLLPMSSWVPVLERPSAKIVDDEEKAFLRQQLLTAYEPHAEEALLSVVAYLRDGQWPELRPAVVFYLRQILAKALNFLQGIVFRTHGEHTTIFPFPGDDVPLVFLWFVAEWWLAHGLKEVIFEATTDQALFYKYFG